MAPYGTTLARWRDMLKIKKKLSLNKEKLRVLTDENMSRVQGGAVNTYGSEYCSSDGANKCTGHWFSAICNNP
jgi:natural product precursor